MGLYKVILFALSLFISLFSQSSFSVEWRGYSIGQFSLLTPGVDSTNRSIGRYSYQHINRFNFFSEWNKLQFESGFEINQIYQLTHLAYLAQDFSEENVPFRIDSPDTRIIKYQDGKDSYYLFMLLDRLVLNYSFSGFDLSIGRQQISFGSAKIINPSDFLAPFAPYAINTEERSGVDAIRLRKSLGINSEIDIGVVFGENLMSDKSAYYFKSLFSYSGIEIRPIFSYHYNAFSFGLDLLSNWNGANIYFESFITNPETEKSYQRYTLGLEYQLNSDLYTVVEYHYNGSGSKNAEDYINILNQFSVVKANNFYLAQNYGSLILTYQVSALHVMSVSSTQNIDDGSNLFAFNWQVSLSEEINLDAGILFGLGDKQNKDLTYKSEFGTYGNQFYLKYTEYF